MPEKKVAIIKIGKTLSGILLTVLAAAGGATGNVLVAVLTAIPGAGLSSLESLKPLLEKKEKESLELSAPPWWTASSQSWQEVCSSIEYHLPASINNVVDRLEQLGKGQSIPTAAMVRRIFEEEVSRNISGWEVRPQERASIATYVVPPILQRSAAILKAATDPIREEALTNMLAQVLNLLNEVQKTQSLPTSGSSAPSSVATTPETHPEAVAATSTQALDSILQQKVNDQAYDVYICYNEADEAEVLKVGELLKSHGILPWLDDEVPGRPRQPQQERQIKRIPVAAVFVGKHAVVGWQALLTYSFIDQFVKRGCPVIPVLLPDSPRRPKLPPFLALFEWVDFRRQDPDPMERLLRGIRR